MSKGSPAKGTAKPKTAWDLLEAVKDQIAREPKRYNQGVWAQPTPLCGTQHCVAGWAVTLMDSEEKTRQLDNTKAPRSYQGRSDFHWNGVPLRAKELLGLTIAQSNELFSPDAVESSLDRWSRELTKTEFCTHASEGIAHIEKFQEKYEAQLKKYRIPAKKKKRKK